MDDQCDLWTRSAVFDAIEHGMRETTTHPTPWETLGWLQANGRHIILEVHDVQALAEGGPDT